MSLGSEAYGAIFPIGCLIIGMSRGVAGRCTLVWVLVYHCLAHRRDLKQEKHHLKEVVFLKREITKKAVPRVFF